MFEMQIVFSPTATSGRYSGQVSVETILEAYAPPQAVPQVADKATRRGVLGGAYHVYRNRDSHPQHCWAFFDWRLEGVTDPQVLEAAKAFRAEPSWAGFLALQEALGVNY